MTSLKKQVKDRRGKFGLTQEEFAIATRVSLSLLKKVECGAHDNITIKTRQRIFKKITPADLARASRKRRGPAKRTHCQSSTGDPLALARAHAHAKASGKGVAPATANQAAAPLPGSANLKKGEKR